MRDLREEFKETALRKRNILPGWRIAVRRYFDRLLAFDRLVTAQQVAWGCRGAPLNERLVGARRISARDTLMELWTFKNALLGEVKIEDREWK
jgi:hypothetical protein